MLTARHPEAKRHRHRFARPLSPAALLTEAELLAASVAPEHRVAADRLLEDLRFGLAREDAHEALLADDGLLVDELRKLTL